MEPKVSVVIATHNRRALLLRCIESLIDQEVEEGSFEAIVAVDGSTDDTVEVVEALEAPFPLRCLVLEKAGKASAQNEAIEIARGSAVLFIDDDVVAGPTLLAAHLEAHREDPSTVGVGRLEQALPRGRDWYASMFARTWNRHHEDLEGRQIDWTACYGGNLSVPRAALLEIGGIATDLEDAEDTELGYRLERAGCTLRFLPRASAVHDDRKGWRRLLEDSKRQGSGQVSLAARHPEMTAKLFGWFGASSRREIVLRRALLALRVSPRSLVPLGRLLPGEGRKEIWFHFVSRLAFWSSAKRALDGERWERLTRGVPVLMYHAFGDVDEGDRYVVPRRALSRQLRLLRLLGYRGVHFEDLACSLRAGEPPPRRAVAITIDDGYLDNLEVAQPVFRRYDFPATIFLVSGKLGGVNDWTPDGALDRRPLLGPDQVRQLRREGVRFGAHTRNHPQLPALADDAVRDEVEGSRSDLEESLGEPVETFAYPFGLFDERAVGAVEGSGFSGACTVEPRLLWMIDDPLRIPRIEVRSTDSLSRFLFKVWLGE